MKNPARFWAESNLQVAIVRFLRAALPASYRVLAIPNGRFEANPRTIARLIREGLWKGAPDLIVVGPTGCAFLEVKAGKGKPSEEQSEWLDWCARNGIPAAVVRSLEDAEAVLAAWNVPLRARAAA